jgi:hypothetical protein
MITESTVTTLHNGKTKEVKNLGWFIRNSRYVKGIAFDFTKGNSDQDGILIATLAIGNNSPTHEYRSGYACYNLFRDLLRRSQWLRDLPVRELR